MKTLSKKFTLCCAIGLTSMLACTEKKTATNAFGTGSKAITLNGIDSIKAAKMVSDFRSDMISSEKTTSFWFSEKFLDAIISTLQYEGADGVRFYFAKDDKGLNSLVMVSTKDGGPRKNPSGTPKHVHQDYFTHNTDQLQQPYTSYVAERGGLTVNNLYDLTDVDQTQPCKPSFHYVDADTAATWARNFRDHHHPNLKPLTTLSVWYKLELFTNMKAYLTAAKLKGLDGDGFRIYVVKKSLGMLVNNPGAISLIFVPTIEKDNQHHDYYECFINEEKFIKRTDPNDNGEECPTFCNEGTTWDEPDTIQVDSKRKK